MHAHPQIRRVPGPRVGSRLEALTNDPASCDPPIALRDGRKYRQRARWKYILPRLIRKVCGRNVGDLTRWVL